ncbi:hypothetical protein BVY11_08625 [Pseudomonas amygdali pv. morsprunorum]|nr:hypothetical protein BVY11_08625 [Pseudomonas amygdali pv. morsprunorum]PPS38497.1 hypothetical protein BVY12_06800 [Pseudomonas amygdali pv. morsprunorum]
MPAPSHAWFARRHGSLYVLEGRELNGEDARSHRCLIQQAVLYAGLQGNQHSFGRVLIEGAAAQEN